jgi:hypothetical protein
VLQVKRGLGIVSNAFVEKLIFSIATGKDKIILLDYDAAAPVASTPISKKPLAVFCTSKSCTVFFHAFFAYFLFIFSLLFNFV